MLKKPGLTALIKNQKGISLVELLVTVALIGIITTSVVSLMTGGIKAYKDAESQVEILDNISSAMNYINKALRESRISDVSIESGGKVLKYIQGTPSAKDGCRIFAENGVLKKQIESPLGSGVWGQKKELTSKEVTVDATFVLKDSTKHIYETTLVVTFKDGRTKTMKSQATVVSVW